MKKKDTTKVEKSYDFLCLKESNSEGFVLDELIKATGWKESSAKTYITKKWENFLKRDKNKYFVKGIVNYSRDEYLRLMSQKDRLSNDPKKPQLPVDAERLVVKAKESAMLALDIYNRPATMFKTEGFTVMMIIAWTSLFHAIFEKRNQSYFYCDKDGKAIMIDGDQKAWELSKCISEFYGASSRPERKNLEFFIGLRNKIEHRFVPAIDPHIGGECQALLLNFDELLTSEFGEYYALREYLSVPLQTATMRNPNQVEALRKFQGKQYDELKDYIDTFREDLPDEIYNDQKYSFLVYLIPKAGNHRSSSDIAIEFLKYEAGNPEFQEIRKQIALIKEKKIPVANPGKYKPGDVCRLVSEKIGKKFTIHNHTQAWKVYDVRKSGETPKGCNVKYCQYDEVHKDYIYTQKWIDFLVNKLSDEGEYNRVISFKW